MNSHLRLILCLLSVLLLTACGWHLRGSINAGNIDSVSITARNPASEFVTVLKHEFQASQVDVHEQSGAASYDIVIMGLNEERRTIGVDGSGRAAKYLLTQTIEFVILDSAGNPVVEQTSRNVEQTYDHDENRALAKENERSLLRQEMYLALAHQVIRALNYAVSNNKPQ